MVDVPYLERGLYGLARAHPAGAMAGHLGAAVVAGSLWTNDHPDLNRDVVAAVRGEMDRIMAGEETVWFNAQRTGITVADLFAPWPDRSSDKGDIGELVHGLAKNIGQLRQSGHNVIFAATAIRALHDHAELATSDVVSGIRRLIALFDSAGPGRGYFGQQSGWKSGHEIRLSPDEGFPAYRDIPSMVETVIDLLVDQAHVRRQGFGGLFHIINHAAALVELSRLGYEDLAAQGLAAHHRHVRLWLALPDMESELGKLQKAEEDPRTAAYWTRRSSAQWSGWLTHRIKTLYGFFTLLPMVKDQGRRERALDQFGYLMA